MTSPTTTAGPSPLDNRTDLRICHVRAIAAPSATGPGASIFNAFDLGRLANGLSSADNLAPQLQATTHRASLELAGDRWGTGRPVSWQRHRLLIAGGGIADVRLISTPWESVTDTIGLLEDLNYETIRGEPSEWDEIHSGKHDEPVSSVQPFHHLVFVPDDQNEPSWETIQRLVYRADLDAIEEQSSISHPEELNRRPGQLAAVGRFGSVLWGLQDYVEASMVLSAAMTVSAASVAATVRRAAHDHLHNHRANLAGQEAAGGQLRQAISELGLDLTFGAEAQATIDHLLPSLRVNAFHRALYLAANVRAQIDLAARMLDRLAVAAVGQDHRGTTRSR